MERAKSKSILPDDRELAAAEAGDLHALARLDKRGFLLGENEDGPAFAKRLRELRENVARMEDSLARQGTFALEDITVHAQDRIPSGFFDEVARKCADLYGFAIDWVPGFFINPKFFLFGGWACCYNPDFFAMFVIRKSFRDRERWLIYSRRELLAHELCHIARIALNSDTFEETFAYQTSSSTFRRLLGGIFLREADTFLFLAATLFLLVGQILRTFAFPLLPAWPLWCVPALATAWLAFRYARLRALLKRARGNAAVAYGPDASKVLFRCSDDDIHALASLRPDEVPAWLERQNSLRWQVIRERFQPKGASE